MESFTSWEVTAKENKWSLGNRSRWRNEDYDRLWRASERELDPLKRAALFICMNDMVVREGVVIPLLVRNEATAVSHKLRGVDITPWGSNLGNLASWSREGEAAPPGSTGPGASEVVVQVLPIELERSRQPVS